MTLVSDDTLGDSYFKKKIILLGGLETLKDEFQKRNSITTLSPKNKNTIGVNISRVDIHSGKNHFEYFLWNVYCGREKAFLRTIFYQGAEAVIVLISEDKVEQIPQYFKEITARLPVITILFLIILKDKSIDEIKEAYLSTPTFNKLIFDNKFNLHKIFSSAHIFGQIGSLFLKKLNTHELEDNYLIDFIEFNNLFDSNHIDDTCNEYFEAQSNGSHYERRIDAQIVKSVISHLDLDLEIEDSDWVHVPNKTFGGEFSIFLRNGNVYFIPEKCVFCKKLSCYRKNRLNNYICIEAETKGWSNVKGMNQKELLVLSKILALIKGKPKILPKTIVNQIQKYLSCPPNNNHK